MEFLIKHVEQCIVQYGTDKCYWLAFSGGVDSHVLLHILYQLKSKLNFRLTAIHINHHLHPEANDWQAHTANICAHYHIPYQSLSVATALSKKNMEASARQARYALLAEKMAVGDILLTAHHADDQAETLLLQLCRGAGPKGLAAMPLSKPFNKGWHVRPLLNFTRAQLTSYAHAQQLKWIHDPSNTNTQLRRNFIRHEILPLLQSRWPNIARALNRSAQHCAAQQQLLSDCLAEDLAHVAGRIKNTLSVPALLTYTPQKQYFLLRAFIMQQGYVLPNTKKLQQMVQSILHAKWDKNPKLSWHDYEMRRHRDLLYLMPTLETLHIPHPINWDLQQSLVIPGVGKLSIEKLPGKGINLDKLINKQVTVTFRQGGEMIFLKGRGRQYLKNLFQEWEVVPWMRNRIPLIFYGQRLIQVVGYALDPEFVAPPRQIGVGIELHAKLSSNPADGADKAAG